MAKLGAVATAKMASERFAGHKNSSVLECVLASPNAMHFPCGIGPFGMPSGGNGPSPGGDWDLRWCGMYAAMPLVWEYEYFQNATFGKEVLLPLLSGLADYWRCWLTREPDGKGGYVLADYDDNISEQGWWMGCGEEQGPTCTKFKNVMMSIGFVKRLFATLPALAAELGEPVLPWWHEEVAEHLPPYAHAVSPVCRQGTVPPLPCYNNSRCPCMNVSTFLMADSGSTLSHRHFGNSRTLLGCRRFRNRISGTPSVLARASSSKLPHVC